MAEQQSRELRQHSARTSARTVLAMVMVTALAATLMIGSVGQSAAREAGQASDWVEVQQARMRLIAGWSPEPASERRIVAGLEVVLPPGWKTYWRSPGDNGVPPLFDLAGSENVAAAVVRYPAPQRFGDPSGEYIGYAGGVLFPIEVTPEDPSQEVSLKVSASIGICKNICVPVDASLTLELPREGADGLPEEIVSALSRVPTPAEAAASDAPRLVAGEVMLEGDAPRINLDVLFPGEQDTAAGDVFVEAEGGFYLPMAKRVEDPGRETVRFAVDLTKADDIAELKGQTLTVTLVGPTGQTEAKLPVR